MECGHCRETITPGTELFSNPLQQDATTHCPYCLYIVSEGTSPGGPPEQLRVNRVTKRREVREAFVDRLLKESQDGRLHCPVCEHGLNKSDELLLRSCDCFRCHYCGHDLATVAYREVAFAEQCWLPVVHALGDLKSKETCRNCAYLGAMARACQKAFSWMPESSSNHTKLLQNLLIGSDWKTPTCSWESDCFAVRQYRALAGDRLRLM